MDHPTNNEQESPVTVIRFDLATVLSPEELARFQDAAARAGAASLTEHFLNLTLRVVPEFRPAA